MILDSEAQRSLLLSIINVVTFKGDSLEAAYNLKTAIKAAEVQEEIKAKQVEDVK